MERVALPVKGHRRHSPGVDRWGAFWYHPAPLGNSRKAGATFADHRSRQQYRPGAEGAEKEDAAGRHLPRDEAPGTLREAQRKAGARARRGDPPLPQAAAQAPAARGRGPALSDLSEIANFKRPSERAAFLLWSWR